MTSDYETLIAFHDQPPLLAHKMFEQYKGLIYKKALLYSRYFKEKITPEDFASETYLKLIYYASYIKPEKVNPNNFSFFCYVTNSCAHILKKCRKSIEKEAFSIDNENCSNYFEAAQSTFDCEQTVLALRKRLNPKQKKILDLRLEGKNIQSIKKELQISYWLVSKTLDQIKVIYEEL